MSTTSLNLDVEQREYSRAVLAGINGGWPRGAQVMRYAADVHSLAFDEEKDDLVEAMLPFGGTPEWNALAPELRSRLLSCGWLIYQANTIFIEVDLVTPACIDILKVTNRDSLPADIALSIAEAMTDEGYHTLLALRTCDIVRERRGLQKVNPRDFHLVGVMREHIRSFASEADRRVARVATACCTENHITDYLSLLADNKTIQPLCAAAVSAHAKDEWTHGSIFTVLARHLIGTLQPRETRIFRDTLEKVAANFFRADIDAWLSVLDDLADPRLDRLRRLLIGRRAQVEESVDFTNDNRGLRKLYEMLDWDRDD
jgi:hypothetical protein